MSAFDLIVCFDEKKMGYGDILFAAKVAGELKRILIAQNQLIGDVFLVCADDKRGLNKVEQAKADCEFGINFVLADEMQRLIDAKLIKPAVIIDGPAPMPKKLKAPQATVIVSLEYTYGPFRAVNLGNSYAKADPVVQGNYNKELEKFEQGLLRLYPNVRKSIVRTGLLDALEEKGIITTDGLIKIGFNLHAQVQGGRTADIHTLKQEFVNKLSSNIKRVLFNSKHEVDFATYEEQTNLTFGYGYSGALDFLDIHEAWSQNDKKNEDVFIVNESSNLREHLKNRL